MGPPFCPKCHNNRDNPNGRKGKCDHVFHSTAPVFGDKDWVGAGKCDKCRTKATMFQRDGQRWCDTHWPRQNAPGAPQ